ncbi:MAG: hypothetical protein J6L69_06395 [Lachnospiraceae bacterium]|nr:hypothetical protein [Lachnospiraceae bacterium]
MNDKVKDLQKKVVDFWNKYDKKQKKMIISITLVLIIAVVIMAYVLTKPTYVELITCDDLTSAANVKDILVENTIDYETTNNNLTFMVKEENLTEATYLIAQEGFTATDYTLEEYANQVSSFSTTSADRERYYLKYLEDKMRSTIMSFDYVKNAYVQISQDEDTPKIIGGKGETYVSVNLELRKEIDSDTAKALANYIRTAVGNDTTEKVTILDSRGNLLFRGEAEKQSADGILTEKEQENMADGLYDDFVNKVTGLLANTQEYSSIVVTPDLKIDFTKIDEVETLYFNDDEVKNSDYLYESEGGSSVGGIPGTDSNDDETDYMIQTGDSSSSSVTVSKNEYAVSSKVTSRTGQQGVVDKADSSVSVSLVKYIVYNEDELKKSGALDDITWEEFKEEHDVIEEIEVKQSIINLIAGASGIAPEDIVVYANQVPVFEPSAGNGEFISNMLPAIIAVITLILLAFIVWRSLRPIEISEVEPELSVEELLASTKEQNKVEEIDFEEQSETGRAIEKFIEENPEAAAALLRNWLNEDWE